jgi:hypothetical protein
MANAAVDICKWSTVRVVKRVGSVDPTRLTRNFWRVGLMFSARYLKLDCTRLVRLKNGVGRVSPWAFSFFFSFFFYFECKLALDWGAQIPISNIFSHGAYAYDINRSFICLRHRWWWWVMKCLSWSFWNLFFASSFLMFCVLGWFP